MNFSRNLENSQVQILSSLFNVPEISNMTYGTLLFYVCNFAVTCVELLYSFTLTEQSAHAQCRYILSTGIRF